MVPINVDIQSSTVMSHTACSPNWLIDDTLRGWGWLVRSRPLWSYYPGTHNSVMGHIILKHICAHQRARISQQQKNTTLMAPSLICFYPLQHIYIYPGVYRIVSVLHSAAILSLSGLNTSRYIEWIDHLEDRLPIQIHRRDKEKLIVWDGRSSKLMSRMSRNCMSISFSVERAD